jgi:hypothetical protein
LRDKNWQFQINVRNDYRRLLLVVGGVPPDAEKGGKEPSGISKCEQGRDRGLTGIHRSEFCTDISQWRDAARERFPVTGWGLQSALVRFGTRILEIIWSAISAPRCAQSGHLRRSYLLSRRPKESAHLISSACPSADVQVYIQKWT